MGASARWLSIVTLVSAATSARASEWVLPPTATAEIAALVGTDDRLSGGQAVGAEIRGDHVLVSVFARDAVVTRFTLRHPDGDDAVVGGFAVDRGPGPIDQALLDELVERMRSSGIAVTWISPRAAPRPDVGRHEDAIAAATDALDRGDAGTARALLSALPDALPTRLAVRVATAWQRLGEGHRVAALAAGFEDAGLGPAVVARVLRSEREAPAALLAMADGRDPCPLSDAADALAALGRDEDARALAAAIHERAPACLPAWLRDLRARVRLGDAAGAQAGLAAARERWRDEPQLDAVEVAVLGMQPDAAPIEALERLARAAPAAAGRLGALARAVSRRPPAERAAWTQRAVFPGGDPVAAFVSGHLALADGDLAAAEEALAPLGPALGEVPAVAVALATVDLRRGRVDAALAHLDRVAVTPATDPAVHYLRAELLRDRDRAAALEALQRYTAGCARVGCPDVERQERAPRVEAELRRCLEQRVDVCVGPWEHQLPGAPPPAPPPPASASPYVNAEDAGRGVPWPLQLGFGVLAVLALVALYRSRRDA